MNILIIGGGNMGGSYMENFIKERTLDKDNLYILDLSEDITDSFKAKGYENVFNEPGEFIRECDMVVLAIKPQQRKSVYSSIKPFLRTDTIAMSIMAGITIKSMKEDLGLAKIVRVMPNLPAQIEMGMSGFTMSDGLNVEELAFCQNILNTTGQAIHFEKEGSLDAVTAISGSGTAYIYYFMKAMVDAGVELGIPQNTAYQMVEQTFYGAVELIKLRDLSPEEWMNRVSSKGGTTRAALDRFEELDVAAGIKEGMLSAFKRAAELGAMEN